MTSKQSLSDLPSVGVWRAVGSQHPMHMVTASFPGAPGLVSDMWCFEATDLHCTGGERLSGGHVAMRHAWDGHEEILVTTALPAAPDAVEIQARLESPDGEPVPCEGQEYPNLNICWQVLRAPMFASWPDPYPEFVSRCFVFTDDGPTFLDKTPRLNIPVRSADDPYNNPPWVQTYLPVWQPYREAQPEAWAANSPARYTYPIIGIVSRDRKYLAAIATEGNTNVCQAWHDCMHNNALWQCDESTGTQIWRWRLYMMPNDPEVLLARVGEDMPRALTPQERRVPA